MACFLAVAANAVQAASIEYSTYSDAQKDGLVYANSFGGTVDFDTTVASGTGTVGLFGDSAGFAASDGVGSLTGRMRTNDTVVGSTMFANGSGFTVSMDLTNVTITNWKDLISFGSPGGTMELQSNEGGQLMLYTNSFAGSTGKSNVMVNGAASEGDGTGMMYGSFDPGTTLTVVYDASNALFKAYLNGTEAYSANLAGANTTVTVTGIALGGNYSNTNRNIGTSTTKLDNLSIWNRALSATEVTSLIVVAPGIDITEGASYSWTGTVDSSLKEVEARVAATAETGDRATLAIAAGEKLSIDSLKITGGAMGLDVDQDGSFTTGELTIGANAGFTRAGKGALTIGALTMNTGSTLTVAAGSTLALGEDRTANVPTTMGEGTEFSTSGQTRTYTAEEGATLTDNRFLKLNGGTLNVNGGGTVEVFGLSLSANGQNVSTVNIAADTTLHIFGTSNDASGGNKAAFGLAHWSAANRVNVEGTLISDAGLVVVTGGDAAVQVKDGGKFIMTKGLEAYIRDGGSKATINVEAGGTLSVGGTNANNYDALAVNLAGGSTVEAYSANTIVGQTLALGDGTVNFSAGEGKSLTINSISGTANINVKGEGSVALGTAMTLPGTLFVESGATLNVNGNLTVSKTITNDGTLNFADGVSLILSSLEGLEGGSSTTYVDALAPESGNGYLSASVIIVNTTNTTSSVSGLSSVKVGADGEAQALRAEGGKYMLDIAGEVGGAYYINKGSVTYGADTNGAEAASSLVLNGGSLVLAKNLAGTTGITAHANADVIVNSGVELAQSSVTKENGVTVTLHGEGEYAVGNAAMGATLDSDWSGVVSITGTRGGLNLNDFANENSTVRLAGVSAWFALPQGDVLLERNIDLRNSGAASALEINAMSGRDYTFTKKVSGLGTILVSDNQNVAGKNITFSGDVSEWKGSFVQAAGVAKKVTFDGAATEINASLVNTGSGLNVVIDNSKDVTVNGSIDSLEGASGSATLTLSGEGSKTFTNVVSVSGLTANGGAVTMSSLGLSGEATLNTNLTVTGNTTLNNGTVNISNGVTYKTGSETIESLNKTDAASVSGTGKVAISTVGITYTNALIDVQGDVTINAKLNSSKLANNAAEQDVTISAEQLVGDNNSLDAAKGDIIITGDATTAVTVKDLAVAADKTVTVGTGGTATVSGTATIAADATVGGNLIIANGATLTLAPTETAVATISGALTMQDGAKLDLTSISVSAKDEQQSILIANVDSATIGSITIKGLDGLDGRKWALQNNAGTVLASGGTIGEFTPAPGSSGALYATADALTLLVAGAPVAPSTLTATAVGTGSSVADGVLTLKTDIDLTSLTGVSKLAITIEDGAWSGIVGDATGEVTLKLLSADGTVLTYDPTFLTVSVNGYVGEGNGKYDLQFIPEPTTATLSLLALAGLAARRRRKH